MMDTQDRLRAGVMFGVKLACNNLTDEEMAALLLSVIAGGDPRPVDGYSKAKILFTEQGGTRMHRDTQDMFIQVGKGRGLI